MSSRPSSRYVSAFDASHARLHFPSQPPSSKVPLINSCALQDSATKTSKKTEALQTNHLSVEEVAARRAELLQSRELMFRADAKAKRVAKIKSKAFRRIRKKQREKDAVLDGLADDGEPADEDERLQMEIARARERATLKHKNTGKWARAMQNRGEIDEDQRRDINEMLVKGERLRRRIQGVGSGDDDDGDDGDESDSDADMADIISAMRSRNLDGWTASMPRQTVKLLASSKACIR